MGKGKEEPAEEVAMEFRVSMHCNACEKKVAKVISNIKGVERFMTDMNNHKVVVMGRFEPDKMLKKLKKKTGKKVEIVIPEGGEVDDGDENVDELNFEGEFMLNEDQDMERVKGLTLVMENGEEMEEGGWCEDDPIFTLFSEENANGCSIM